MSKNNLLDTVMGYLTGIKDRVTRSDKPRSVNDPAFDTHMKQTDAADEDFDTRLASNEPGAKKAKVKKQDPKVAKGSGRK